MGAVNCKKHVGWSWHEWPINSVLGDKCFCGEVRLEQQDLGGIRTHKSMKTLDEIGIHFQTDKASQFSRTYAKPHDYCRHLERLFEPMRDQLIKVLEIGVGGGESVRTWLEYFPNARVFGVDLVSSTNEWNTPGAKTHERYVFSCGNQSDPKFWKKFIEAYGEFDIVIDDGSHVTKDTITTFNSLWTHVRSGGIYEIEDLNVMPDLSPFIGAINAKVINGEGNFDSIYFARELCVIRKK